MSKYYDDQGNEVEGVLSPDEAKALQEKASKLEGELSQKEEELGKFSNKDLNFSKLRDAAKRSKQEGAQEERDKAEKEKEELEAEIKIVLDKYQAMYLPIIKEENTLSKKTQTASLFLLKKKEQ